MNDTNNNGTVVVQIMPVGILLFMTFLVLKLTNVIAWSWWFITMPLWIAFAIVLAVFLVGVFAILMTALISTTIGHFRNKPKANKFQKLKEEIDGTK
jgi:hypothetical protein